MIKFENIYSEIISLPNLYRAFQSAKQGKKVKRTIEFESNLNENLWNLHEELLNKKYNVSPYFEFYVTDYKTRKIMCPSFRDQVVQHAIFNYLEQIYEKSFIYDSYACRKDKGTHKACLRLKKFVNSCKEGYFIKCDISKYFYSIDHYKLKEIIGKKINDKDTLWLIYKIIDSHKEENMSSHIDNNLYNKQEKGIPIGNLMSQLFANIYLNELDYFAKQELRIKNYIRYVDDFIIIGKDYNELKQKLSSIKEFLYNRLLLKLENKKIQINRISFGVDFVGYVCFDKFIRVRTKNYRRFIFKIKEKENDYYSGNISFDKIKASFISYLGHLSHTNSEYIKENINNRLIVIADIETVQRGGNWNNGANAGPFSANLNNAPSDLNNNIGFRCDEQKEDITPLRRCYQPYAQLQLQSYNENRSRNITGERPVIPAMRR